MQTKPEAKPTKKVLLVLGDTTSGHQEDGKGDMRETTLDGNGISKASQENPSGFSYVIASKKPSNQPRGEEWRENYLLAASNLLSLIGPAFPVCRSCLPALRVAMSEGEPRSMGLVRSKLLQPVSQQLWWKPWQKPLFTWEGCSVRRKDGNLSK